MSICFLVLILFIASACNNYCYQSCSVFNAHASCYSACECSDNGQVMQYPDKVKSDYGSKKLSLLASSQCTQDALDTCSQLTSYNDYLNCMTGRSCEPFADFYWIIDNVPSKFWIAVDPFMLLKYIDNNDDLISFQQFDSCQRYCYGDYLNSVAGDQSNKNFKQCLNSCDDRILQEKERNCKRKCKNGANNKNSDYSDCMNKRCKKANEYLSTYTEAEIDVTDLPMIESMDIEYYRDE